MSVFESYDELIDRIDSFAQYEDDSLVKNFASLFLWLLCSLVAYAGLFVIRHRQITGLPFGYLTYVWKLVSPDLNFPSWKILQFCAIYVVLWLTTYIPRQKFPLDLLIRFFIVVSCIIASVEAYWFSAGISCIAFFLFVMGLNCAKRAIVNQSSQGRKTTGARFGYALCSFILMLSSSVFLSFSMAKYGMLNDEIQQKVCGSFRLIKLDVEDGKFINGWMIFNSSESVSMMCKSQEGLDGFYTAVDVPSSSIRMVSYYPKYENAEEKSNAFVACSSDR